ncbi:putative rna processing protein [Phaeomoniella chlamydospora]|uniref:Polynucleotide 5'-hydroxyl-kinase GRC3 n=1 Tax=Phaeomoniella chlamydospora TaxID=158046 RepID=A0A0G2DVT1_PHACM|nr:putative rna processing protein [Phaeomoniella chlamydospora]
MKRTKNVSAFARTKAAGGSPATEIPQANEFEILAAPAALSKPAKSADEIFTLRNGATRVELVMRGVVGVKLHAGESFAAVGVFKLLVKRGAVEVHGARLEAREDLYEHNIFSATSHALPVITGLDGPEAGEPMNEVYLASSTSGIRDFDMLSASFRGLWEIKSGQETEENRDFKPTFQIIGYHFKYDKKAHKFLSPFLPNRAWKEAVAEISPQNSLPADKMLKILVCGPKNTGKSTMAKYIANHLLSPYENTGKHWSENDGVAILDLDPGQPEFGPPGTLSLVHLRSPLFGPSYTHPLQHASLNTRKDAIIHQHFLGSTTPRASPGTYIECILHLLAKYKRLTYYHQNCHLIINASGWIIGDGLTFLKTLLDEVTPTFVFHMSDSGPEEAIRTLVTQCNHSNTALRLISTQASPSTKPAIELRKMFLQSYLHMRTTRTANHIRWDVISIRNMKRLTLPYEGPQGSGGVVLLDDLPTDISGYSPDWVMGIVALRSLDALKDMHNDPIGSSSRNLTCELCWPFKVSPGSHVWKFDSHRPVGINPWSSYCLGVGVNPHHQYVKRQIVIHTPVTKEDVECAKRDGYGIILLVVMKVPPQTCLADEEQLIRERNRRENRAWAVLGHELSKGEKDEKAEDVHPAELLNRIHRRHDAVNDFSHQRSDYKLEDSEDAHMADLKI